MVGKNVRKNDIAWKIGILVCMTVETRVILTFHLPTIRETPLAMLTLWAVFPQVLRTIIFYGRSFGFLRNGYIKLLTSYVRLWKYCTWTSREKVRGVGGKLVYCDRFVGCTISRCSLSYISVIRSLSWFEPVNLPAGDPHFVPWIFCLELVLW